MKELVAAIQAKMKAGVPALKYIDRDWGQMEAGNPPVKFPCALIDVRSAQYANGSNRFQTGVATVVVKLFDIRHPMSSGITTAYRRQQVDDGWQLMQDVNRVLHGNRTGFPEQFGMLMRTSMTRRLEAGYSSIEITYTIGFTDATAVPERIAVSLADVKVMASPM
jgi:hypothetical protein